MRSDRYLRIALAFLVGCLSASIATAQPRRNQKTLLEDADRAFTQKRYQEAADLYGQVIVLAPNNPQAHFRKGYAHYNLNQYDLALSEFNFALSQGFKPLEIYKVRAFIYHSQKNDDAALQDVQKGLALAPNDLMLLRGAVEINMDRKAFADAIRSAQNVLKVAPNDADSYYSLARAYFAIGDLKAQQRAAESALTNGTRYPGEAYYLLADACRRQGDTACAIEAYQKGIGIKTDVLQSYRELAELYRNDNRVIDAMNTLKKAQGLFPPNGLLFMDLSRLYSLADRPDDALQSAQAAVQLMSDDPAALTNLCRAFNDTKSYDMAIVTCNTALRLKPNDGETYFYLGRANNLAGKTAEATRSYTQAVRALADQVQKGPVSADTWYLLGNAYFADNQRDKAADAYLKCLELTPKSVKARYNLGIIYTRLKNKGGATEQYNALKGLDAKLADALKTEIDKM